MTIFTYYLLGVFVSFLIFIFLPPKLSEIYFGLENNGPGLGFTIIVWPVALIVFLVNWFVYIFYVPIALITKAVIYIREKIYGN